MYVVNKDMLDEKIKEDECLMSQIPDLLISLKILKKYNGKCNDIDAPSCYSCPFLNFDCSNKIKISNYCLDNRIYTDEDMAIWNKNRKITKKYLKELL